MGSLTASALFDSTLLIDHLNGVEAATDILAVSVERVISIVSWIEVLAGPATSERVARRLLSTCEVLPLTPEVAEEAAFIRRGRKKLRLPDSIILATARVHGRILMTRNTKDFLAGEPGIVIPYRL